MSGKEPPLVVNGVFKGGGAKGVVYAGAARACAERGIRFASVAGSSAGAITAALIAARLTANELDKAAAAGLERVQRRILRRFLPFTAKSVFAVDGLREWLEEWLVQKACAGKVASNPVTFEELFTATKIELNVVAMDLDTRQPIVFNHVTAPSCEVTRAVLASCAIPVAMPPGRVLLEDGRGRRRVHRLVDGGAWANYPAFVYADPSFRKYVRLPPSPHPTIGFVIDPPPASQRKVLEMKDGRRSYTDRGSGGRAGRLGALLNWPIMRAIAVLVPIIVVAVMLSWFVSQTSSYFGEVAFLPDGVEPVILILITTIFCVVAATSALFAAILWRFGSEAFDVGLPAMFASLSVGPRVPDWVGLASTDRVVRLSVPAGITTTRFRIPARVRDEAIARAHYEAAKQLNRLFPDRARRLPPGGDSEITVEADRANGEPARLLYGLFLALLGGAVFSVGTPALIADLTDNDWKWIPIWGGALLLTAAGTIVIGIVVRQYELEHGRRRSSGGRIAFRAAVLLASFLGLTYAVVTAGGSLSRLAEFSTSSGRVVDKFSNSSAFYDVRFDPPLANASFGGDSSAVRYCRPATGASCVVFDSTNTSIDVGDTVTVAVVAATGEAFLAGDQWRAKSMTRRFLIAWEWAAFALFLLWTGIEAARMIRGADVDTQQREHPNRSGRGSYSPPAW